MMRILAAVVALTIVPNYSCLAGMIYFSELGAGQSISRARLDGTGIELLTALGDETSRDIALDLANGKLYGTELGGTVGRSNLNGTGLESIVSGVGVTEWGIDLDLINGHVYWTDRDADAIFRSGLDGTGVTMLLSSGQPRGIEVDPIGGKVYWADSGDGGAQALLRANLDGSGIEVLATGFRPRFLDLDVENGLVYWTDSAAGTIERSNVDGTNRQLVLSGLNRPIGIALDVGNDRMFWVESPSSAPGFVRSSALDGSGTQTIISGLTSPSAIALDLRSPVPEPSTLVIFCIGCACLIGARFRRLVLSRPRA